jgi:hypothetical protein
MGTVTPEDRRQLEATVSDRRSMFGGPKIIFATAESCGTAEIMRRTVMAVGVMGLAGQDAQTRRAALPPDAVQQVIDLTHGHRRQKQPIG